MKFKVDENLPVEVVEILQEVDHDAFTVGDQGLGGAPENEVAGRCREEGRALVTLDVGFGDIRNYPPSDHGGMIVLRLRRQDKNSVLQVVKRLLIVIETEQLEGKLWIVDEERLRIRG